MELADSETYTDLRLDGGTLAGVRGAAIHGGLLRGVSLAGQAFRLLHLERVRFDDCDLSNCDLEIPFLDEVIFQGCRLTGLRVRGGRAVDLSLQESHGQYAQFDGTEMRASRFERCQLGEVTFDGADLTRSVFSDCDLRGAVLMRVRMRGTDLRGCRIDGLRATLDDLSGAVLDPRQAAAILHGQASITVLEPGEEIPDGS
ncbi:MAG: hypothetical protein NVS9B1_22190 [Candidatus Dormibacteraceae bacterium]